MSTVFTILAILNFLAAFFHLGLFTFAGMEPRYLLYALLNLAGYALCLVAAKAHQKQLGRK